MSSATFETSLTDQKCASWNWYNLFIYCDATRDNSNSIRDNSIHQHPNFAYSKTSFAFAAVAKSILTRLLIRWTYSIWLFLSSK
jgi:nucleoside-specific outer membrane channel protein Tsx